MDNSTAAALIDDFHALIPGLPECAAPRGVPAAAP
jgi:hypothetical protein